MLDFKRSEQRILNYFGQQWVGSLFTMPSAYRADAASTLGSTVWRHGPPIPDCQTGVHAAHCNVSPPTHSLSPVGSPIPPTVAAALPASRLETLIAWDFPAPSATDSTTATARRASPAWPVEHCAPHSGPPSKSAHRFARERI